MFLLRPSPKLNNTQTKTFYRRVYWFLRKDKFLPYKWRERVPISVPRHRLDYVMTHLYRKGSIF